MPKSEQLMAMQSGSRVSGQLMYVGTVSADRGSLMTLRALQVLQRQRNDVEFVCIGPINPKHQEELESFITQAGLKKVRFLGRMRSADAWRVAAEGHIGLATLLPKPNYVESYPTKLFEYMAIGLPVIASNFPLYREIVETAGCGICVDPESPEQIAAAIAAILEDPRMASEMARRGQEAALQRFRWDIEAEKLKLFYGRVLARAKPSSRLIASS